MASLEFESIQVKANGRTILKDISFTFEGTRLAVIGANGSGKSTLLRLINGLRKADAGAVRLDGAEISASQHTLRRRVGFVFQNPEAQILLPTVEEDILFGLRQWNVPAAEWDGRLDAVLDRFNLGHLRSQPCHSLSGGEKQRLALAAVMILDPDFLLLDEPTTLLDRPSVCEFRRHLTNIASTVVMATHNFDDLVGFDQALVLDRGELIFCGPVNESIACYEKVVCG